MAKSKDKQDFDAFGYFPSSRTIKAEGGIQSRNQRGSFAANWWAKRWLAVLEDYDIGSRLQRGRSYARRGQVLNIDITASQIKARVQGSQRKPYQVTIQVKAITDADWEKVLDAASQQAIFAAELLDGTMPQAIETVFNTAEVSLFPTHYDDLSTECSCPDYSNPCKHIAAVYYLLGEQFDQDPFVIFTLRGRTREQVIEALRQRRTAAAGKSDDGDIAVASAPAAVSLTQQIANFWGEESFHWTPAQITVPEIDAGVLRRLGAPPYDVKKGLELLYPAMTTHVDSKINR